MGKLIHETSRYRRHCFFVSLYYVPLGGTNHFDNQLDANEMTNSKTLLDTARVTDLQGLKFIIKDYQRGYRWDRQQAHDLLQDIWEFPMESEDEWYCIQPLVVKPIAESSENLKEKLRKLADEEDISVEKIQSEFAAKSSYEVIDGQQRLTTLYILMKILGIEDPFYVEYETREKSYDFLKSILEQEASSTKDCIDFYNMLEVRDEMQEWFEADKRDKGRFLQLLDSVRFIWYETDEDAIDVFERLNIGKIALTNAELIRALFLNKHNFSKDGDRFALDQHKMALTWDEMEKKLQDDEFWLFIHSKDWDRPTRIDFLFDIICQNDTLELQKALNLDDEKFNKRLGNDKYRTFRYFYEYVQKEGSVKRPDAVKICWHQVEEYFHIFEEWFSDMELYHYIGFLIETSDVQDTRLILSLLREWYGEKSENPENPQNGKRRLVTKKEFKDAIRDRIKEHFLKNERTKVYYTLNDLRYGDPRTKDALLLYNLETVVRQNSSYKAEERYRMESFYRFPFHLYKKEVGKNNKGWDVEHIDSATTNLLTSPKEQKDWVGTAYVELSKEDRDLFRERVKKFLTDKGSIDDRSDFQNLFDDILHVIPQSDDPLIEHPKEQENEKYAIWNLALLDSGTNRSYKNAIFPAKRRSIIGRDKGEVYTIGFDKEGEPTITEKESAIAFIPPCTKNAFLKYYSPNSNNILTWGKKDATLYLEDMKKILEPFIAEK